MDKKKKPARKHHYVPRGQLARFTANGNKDDLLYIMDLAKEREIRQGTPGSVAFENDLYTINIEGMEPDVLEQLIANEIENPAYHVFRYMDALKCLPHINSPDFEALMRFVAFSHIRNPFVRNTTEESEKKIVNFILDFTLENEGRFESVSKKAGVAHSHEAYQTLKKLNGQGAIKVQIIDRTPYIGMMLSILPNITRVLVGRKWDMLICDDCRREFICSDRPLAVFWPQDLRGQMPAGLVYSKAQVTFPISKHICLLSTDISSGRSIQIDREFVDLVNRYTARYAVRCLFASKKEIFDAVEK